jgi:hypothetical protein
MGVLHVDLQWVDDETWRCPPFGGTSASHRAGHIRKEMLVPLLLLFIYSLYVAGVDWQEVQTKRKVRSK